eukprot:PLAT11387.2.p1 GENE.PLAT11387.2~~PLAT11387.2.p1  ORF type:complete len:277 (-),score=64.22 PLAT11387.2:39-869(-)
MHLTNYSLNKLSDGYVHADGEDGAEGESSATKRPFSVVWQQLRDRGFDTDAAWDSICRTVSYSLASLAPFIATHCRKVFGRRTVEGTFPCFHLIGFDIMLDSSGKAWLIELNSSPSLNIAHEVEVSPGVMEEVASAVDETVKIGAVAGALRIALLKEPADNYVCVAGPEARRALPAELSILERIRAVFQQAAGVRDSTSVSSVQFNRLARRCGFASVDNDLLFIRMTKRTGKPALTSSSFCDALFHVALRMYPDASPLESLDRLVRQMEDALGLVL